MGRIRSVLRAYALLDIPPEKVLELVDQKMQHFELGTIATIAVAVTRAPFETVRIATAGHLPPILAAPGAAPVVLPITPEPLLGAGLAERRSSSEFTFPPGSLMAMYTDGLVERRGEALDVGLERLRGIVAPESPHTLTGTIMRRLIGDAAPADDIALVLVRRATDSTDPTD